MGERLVESAETDPVTTQQVQEQLMNGSSQLVAALQERAEKKLYNDVDFRKLVDYLRGKTDLFARGLLPAEDHSALSAQVTEFFNMANVSARYSNHLETSDRVIRYLVDDLQRFMLDGDMLSEEAKTELLGRSAEAAQQTTEVG